MLSVQWLSMLLLLRGCTKCFGLIISLSVQHTPNGHSDTPQARTQMYAVMIEIDHNDAIHQAHMIITYTHAYLGELQTTQRPLSYPYTRELRGRTERFGIISPHQCNILTHQTHTHTQHRLHIEHIPHTKVESRLYCRHPFPPVPLRNHT